MLVYKLIHSDKCLHRKQRTVYPVGAYEEVAPEGRDLSCIGVLHYGYHVYECLGLGKCELVACLFVEAEPCVCHVAGAVVDGNHIFVLLGHAGGVVHLDDAVSLYRSIPEYKLVFAESYKVYCVLELVLGGVVLVIILAVMLPMFNMVNVSF